MDTDNNDFHVNFGVFSVVTMDKPWLPNRWTFLLHVQGYPWSLSLPWQMDFLHALVVLVGYSVQSSSLSVIRYTHCYIVIRVQGEPMETTESWPWDIRKGNVHVSMEETRVPCYQDDYQCHVIRNRTTCKCGNMCLGSESGGYDGGFYPITLLISQISTQGRI